MLKKVKVITILLIICSICLSLSLNLFALDKYSTIPSKGTYPGIKAAKPYNLKSSDIRWLCYYNKTRELKWVDRVQKLKVSVRADGTYSQTIRIGGTVQKIVELFSELGRATFSGVIYRTKYDCVNEKTRKYTIQKKHIAYDSSKGPYKKYRDMGKKITYKTYKFVKHVYSSWDIY